MKTYTAFIASEWPRFYTIFQHWTRTYYKTEGVIFKTKKYKRQLQHRRKLNKHINWLITHKFKTTNWDYRYINKNFRKEDIIVLMRNES